MSIKLSKLLRTGKHLQDIPQSIIDPEKTQNKFVELQEAGSALVGHAGDLDELKANRLGVVMATSAGSALETLREYAGLGIEFDLYDGDGEAIFPPVPPGETA